MRYALYFTPPVDHELTRAAGRWLGRDAFSGQRLEQPAVRGFDAEMFSALTADPRRYGFHATLKAPFALAEGYTEEELIAEIVSFADEMQAFDIPQTVIGRLGSFFALVPAFECAELQAFAAEVVRRFEPFRAPLSAADIARRNPASLGEAERGNLAQWGYPYVFDQFRFHMTLTGPVPVEQAPAMETALMAHFSRHHGQPLTISGLALFQEPSRGADFIVHSLFPLGKAAHRKTA